MSEANSVSDLKTRAVELLRSAGWSGLATRLERGKKTPREALSEMRVFWYYSAPFASDAAAIAALEALVVSEQAASTATAHATATIAELRVHCDALRTDLTTAIDDRAAVRVLHAEALSIQSQIWDAVGGQREGESLVDAVRRVVEERDAMREERRVALAEDAAAMERLRRLAEPRSLPKPDRVVMRQRWACDDIDGDLYVRSHPVWGVPTVSKSDEVGLSHTMENKPSEMWVSARLMLTSPRWRYLGNGERPIESDTKEASVGELDSVLNKASGGTEHGRIRCDASAQWVSRSRGEQAKANVEVVPCVVQVHTGEIQRLFDEACEAGRVEAKAEIDRLRKEVTAHLEGIAHLSKELEKSHRDWAGACEVAEQRGQVAMLSRIRRLVAQRIDAYEASGGRIAAAPLLSLGEQLAAPLLSLGEQLAALPIANTPTASASEGPGEAGPGYGGTETAGATESVAREGDDARREPHLGDVVLLADTDDADDFHPAIIRNVRDDGKYDLWAAVPMAPFVYGVPRSRIRLRD